MHLHVVQFSGGAGSAVAAKLVIDEHGTENVVLLFNDTRAEHPDAKRFRESVARFLGVPITERSHALDLWGLIDREHCLPSDRIPFCSRALKIEVRMAYLKELDAQGHTYTQYNGMGPQEYLRAQNSQAHAERLGHDLRFPLIEHKVFQPKEVVKSWGICLPQPYLYLEHNNCIPCFKASSKKYWKAIFEHYPEQYEQAAAMERKWKHTVLKDISLDALAVVFASGQQIDMGMEDNMPPCACMA
jgi:hypothetical protein